MTVDKIETRLASVGHPLPEVPVPDGSYVPAVRFGALVFRAGQLPLRELPRQQESCVVEVKSVARYPSRRPQEAARLCTLNALAAVRTSVGSLEAVVQVVKLMGFVASAEKFNDQPKVIDAASELIVEAFGEKRRHARSAIGVSELPRGSPVEVEILVAVRDDF